MGNTTFECSQPTQQGCFAATAELPEIRIVTMRTLSVESCRLIHCISMYINLQVVLNMYFMGRLRQMDRVDFDIFNICQGFLIRFVFG